MYHSLLVVSGIVSNITFFNRAKYLENAFLKMIDNRISYKKNDVILTDSNLIENNFVNLMTILMKLRAHAYFNKIIFVSLILSLNN